MTYANRVPVGDHSTLLRVFDLVSVESIGTSIALGIGSVATVTRSLNGLRCAHACRAASCQRSSTSRVLSGDHELDRPGWPSTNFVGREEITRCKPLPSG
jgi:hypothetical protein